MVRPHPAVWRLVHGVLLVYTLALVWMLFQTVDDARQVLKVRGRGRAGAAAELGRLAGSPASCAGRGRQVVAVLLLEQPGRSHSAPPPVLLHPRAQHLSPSLGVPVEYRSYAADCRLLLPGGAPNWPAISATVWDEFVVAHALGWLAKALVLRNHLLLWTASVRGHVPALRRWAAPPRGSPRRQRAVPALERPCRCGGAGCGGA
jgi:phosphatidylserine synthase 2